MTMMIVNLPVTDLERAKTFYTAIGFRLNPMFTDHNAACVFVEEEHSAVMITTRDYFQTFTDLPIGDPAVNPSVATAIFLDSRDGGRSRPLCRTRRGRLGAASRSRLRLHVPAPAQRSRRQHPRIRLDGPGRRRRPRGRREPAGLTGSRRQWLHATTGSTAASRERWSSWASAGPCSSSATCSSGRAATESSPRGCPGSRATSSPRGSRSCRRPVSSAGCRARA